MPPQGRARWCLQIQTLFIAIFYKKFDTQSRNDILLWNPFKKITPVYLTKEIQGEKRQANNLFKTLKTEIDYDLVKDESL